MLPITAVVNMKKEVEILDALFRHATEGIIISDTRGKIIMVNPTAQQLFGYSEKELEDLSIDDLVPKRYSTHHKGYRNSYIANPEPRAMGVGRDLYALRKDGSEFPVEISLSTFDTSEGRFVLSFLIDITIRKKQEEALQLANASITRLNEDLEQRVAERTEELAYTVNQLAESKQEVIQALEREKQLNELKSRFVTTASHEFRTPLTTILSSVSLIARYTGSDEQEKRMKHVSKIKSAVTNLTHILNDFLSLGKLEEGQVRNNPDWMNIETLSETVVDELKETLKEGQQIEYTHTCADNEVFQDRQIIKNILINLIGNAIKYSDEGKTITLMTACTTERLIITVKDQGIGIPDEDKQHLFERFFRAGNAANIQGTGLGLNIVKKYVELLNGEISYSSVLNEGTTFIVDIPRH
jgi:PAS domain S-box-containing protein